MCFGRKTTDGQPTQVHCKITLSSFAVDVIMKSLRTMPPPNKVFCAAYDYARNADLSKGYCNLKRKLGVTMHFSKIIKQEQF